MIYCYSTNRDMRGYSGVDNVKHLFYMNYFVYVTDVMSIIICMFLLF